MFDETKFTSYSTFNYDLKEKSDFSEEEGNCGVLLKIDEDPDVSSERNEVPDD